MRPVILVTGRDGQVGHSLISALRPLGEVTALGRAECDLSDPDSIARAVRAVGPAIIVNAAAYTAVDKAESNKDAAFAINARGPEHLARLSREAGATLIHYSTDYVFDGEKPSPYVESDPVHPLSVYGASKLAGEEAVRAATSEHLILRTSWVFSAHGANFLKTMLRLAAERESLDVVADQFGAPTSADLIADVTAHMVEAVLNKRAAFGTYHLAATGQTSWHGYAVFLIEAARRLGFAVKVEEVRPIPASAYRAAAPRPANSRLDTAKLRAGFPIALPPWQDGVMAVLETLIRP